MESSITGGGRHPQRIVAAGRLGGRGPDRPVSGRVNGHRPLSLLAVALLIAFLLPFPAAEVRADWDGGHCSSGAAETSRTWFFAEGCTRPGFEEWVCVFNPGEAPGELRFRFLSGEGEKGPLSCPIGAESRLTLNVNQAAGPGLDVSVVLEASVGVTAERATYFRHGGGGWAGGHAGQGAAEASLTWYFAEGTTRPGFETWLCIANPGLESAGVRLDLMLGAGQGENRAVTFKIPAGCRSTLRINDLLPAGCDVSLVLRSDRPVVAERPVYFSYRGGWEGGHVALGATQPSDHWYFAEGCTRPGFEEWVCLLNPEDREASVTLSFMDHEGPVREVSMAVPPRRRATLMVNEVLEPGLDVSCIVTSRPSLVVERPMYFSYQGWAAGGHINPGSTAPARSAFFAEGCTRNGFQEYLCVLNPNPTELLLRATFAHAEGKLAESTLGVAPRSRLTLNVADFAGREKDVSVGLRGELPFVAERAVYFRYSPLSTITLCAVGDVNLDLDQFRAGYGPHYPWTEVSSLLRAADLSFANLECAVSSGGSPVAGKAFTFRGPPAALPAMRDAGIDVVSHANNHARDYGPQALLETLSNLDSCGLYHCGSGPDDASAHSPATLAGEGLRVAFLAYNDVDHPGWTAGPGYPGVAGARDVKRMAADIAAAGSSAELVVVSFHWGEERSFAPTARQRALAHLAVDSGADLVLGHHPHVIQGFEIYGGRLIAYSLGNFVFNPGSTEGTYTVLTRITLGARGQLSAEVFPARILNGRPVLMSGGEALSWLGRIAGMCAALGTPTSLRGEVLCIP